jgi:hypothetical protein
MHFINLFSDSIKNNHFAIYSNLVKQAIIFNKKIIIQENDNAEDQLLSLFNLTEVSMYPLLDNHKYQIINNYVVMIMSSTLDSVYLKKHRSDIKRLLLSERENISEPKYIEKISKIISLLKDVSSKLITI